MLKLQQMLMVNSYLQAVQNLVRRLSLLVKNSLTDFGKKTVTISVLLRLIQIQATRDSLNRKFGFQTTTRVQCLTVTNLKQVLHSTASEQCTKMTRDLQNSKLTTMITAKQIQQNLHTTDSGIRVTFLLLSAHLLSSSQK